MKIIVKLLLLCLVSGQLCGVMAPWYWVGFPVQLNSDYPGNPQPLIGAHFTFIFDTYHYENGKKYPAGRIMQSNSTILHWYVALMPQRKNVQLIDKSRQVASIEPTPELLSMLQLPKETVTIPIIALGTPDTWSQLWIKDRQMMREEFKEGQSGVKKPRKRWLVS